MAINSVPYTRFNPTVNGCLHIGHLYMILLNEQIAHNGGGVFIFRFDDNQEGNIAKFGTVKIQALCEQMQEEMAWLGVPVDKWVYQSQLSKIVREVLKGWMGHEPMDIPLTPEWRPQVLSAITFPYQFTPYLTAERVILDWLDSINQIIRGEELLTEFGLYCYFVTQFNLPKPNHIYVPKLSFGLTGAQEISKTAGNFRLEDLRKMGYTANELKETLAQSCLVDPKWGWSIANLTAQPRWKMP